MLDSYVVLLAQKGISPVVMEQYAHFAAWFASFKQK